MVAVAPPTLIAANTFSTIFITLTTASLTIAQMNFTNTTHDFAFRQVDVAPKSSDLLQTATASNSLECVKQREMVKFS